MPDPQGVEDLAQQLGFKSAEQLFEAVGKDEFSLRNIELLLHPHAPLPDEEPRLKPASAAASGANGRLLVGGLDSLPGVLVAGIVVGLLESLATGVLDPLVGGGTRDVVASVIILATLLLRPYGLFGREHIERV